LEAASRLCEVCVDIGWEFVFQAQLFPAHLDVNVTVSRIRDYSPHFREIFSSGMTLTDCILGIHFDMEARKQIASKEL
jgi:hypothetical protein